MCFCAKKWRVWMLFFLMRVCVDWHQKRKEIARFEKRTFGWKTMVEVEKIPVKVLKWRFETWIWNAEVPEVNKQIWKCCDGYGKGRLIISSVFSLNEREFGKLEKQKTKYFGRCVAERWSNDMWKIMKALQAEVPWFLHTAAISVYISRDERDSEWIRNVTD